MKKQLFLVSLFLSLIFTGLSAQSKLFGGLDLGFSSNDNESTFLLGPKIGYWLNDNSALVGGIFYTSNKDKTQDPEVTTSGFGIGAQYRFCWHSGDNFYFYLAPGVDYASLKADNGTNDVKTNTFNVSLSPGISYMLADKWSINAEMGLLNYNSTKVGDFDAATQFDVDMNMSSLSFGLWYHF